MEMMVVMLIVAVIAAATAPMINKKMIENASGDSPWIWTSAMNNSIAYNIRGTEGAIATIGAVKPPENTKTMFHIDNKTSGVNHITLGFKKESNGPEYINISATDNSIMLADGGVGENSVAIGVKTDTSGANDCVGIGYNVSTLDHKNGVAIGSGATIQASYEDSASIGTSAYSGHRSIAIGSRTNAQEEAVAIGVDAVAHTNSIAIGSKSGAEPTATAENSIAIGYNTKATKNSITIGMERPAGPPEPVVSGQYSIAIGRGAQAKGAYDLAIGEGARIKDHQYSPNQYPSYATAIGPYTLVHGSNSIAIGKNAKVESIYNGTPSSVYDSVAIGSSAVVNNQQSIAIGNNATTSTARSIAIGYNATNLTGSNAIAIGNGATVSHSNSVAIGVGATTTAKNQIVLGNANTTVYIPGKLVVEKDTYLGANTSAVNYIRLQNLPGGAGNHMYKFYNNNSIVGIIPDVEDGDYKDLGQTNGIRNMPSDRRLKDVGEVFNAGLEEVKKLEVFNYTFKKDPNKTPRVGVMAQDLEKIFPKAVMKGDDGFLRIRMEDMFYAVVNAIKELDTKITAIVEEVKTAVADIADLKIKSAEYEKTIAELVEQNKAQAKALKDLEKRLAKLEKKAKKAEPIEQEEVEE